MKLFTLANALTLTNLLSGSIACIFAIKGFPLQYIGICLVISLAADFLDGFVARWLKSSGELGVQLDSLADMVSFGLLPGILMMKFTNEFFPAQIFQSNYNFWEGLNLEENSLFFILVSCFSLFITLFSALRLAKFNIDTEQTSYFKGLNTPANTIFIFSVGYLGIGNPYILIGIIVLSCYFLISNIPMFSFKLKGFNLKEDYYLPVFLGLSIIALCIFGIPALSFIILGYILTSLVFRNKFVK